MKKSSHGEARCNPARRDRRIKRSRSLPTINTNMIRESAGSRPSANLDGTFKNLSIHFPEGAAIKLRFRSERSTGNSGEIGEEVYRLVEIGVGLESLGIGAEAIGALEEEFKSSSHGNISAKA